MRAYRWALLTLALAAAGCGGTTVDQMTGPGAVKCQIGLTPSTQSVPAAASQFTVALAAERECAWSSRTDAAWAQPSPASGQGEATLTLNVGINTQQVARTATITVNDATLVISQQAAAAPCSYSITPTSRSFSDPGGTGTFTLQTGAACAWTASASVSWITVQSAASGTGPTTVTYLVDRNSSHQTRTGAVTIGGRSHVVVQTGR